MPHKQLAMKHHCTFQTFWRGFTDWYADRTSERALSIACAEQRASSRSLVLLLLVIVVGLMVSGMAFAFLGPLLAGGLTLIGTAAVSQACQLLGLVAAAVVFVWVPYVRLKRVHRFCSAMCQRGYELESGARQRVSCYT